MSAAMYETLRELARRHDAWLERLLTTARPALDAALHDAFRTRRELVSISFNVTPHAVNGVEFLRRDGLTYCADDGVTTGATKHANLNPRRYQPLGDLLVANPEIIRAALLVTAAHVVATPDGEVSVTALDP